MQPYVIVRESLTARYPHRPWKQFVIVSPPVTSAPVVIIHMEQALLGWNFGRLDYQTTEDWPGMSGEQIVRWKQANPDESARQPTKEERELVLSWLEAKLQGLDWRR